MRRALPTSPEYGSLGLRSPPHLTPTPLVLWAFPFTYLVLAAVVAAPGHSQVMLGTKKFVRTLRPTRRYGLPGNSTLAFWLGNYYWIRPENLVSVSLRYHRAKLLGNFVPSFVVRTNLLGKHRLAENHYLLRNTETPI